MYYCLFLYLQWNIKMSSAISYVFNQIPLYCRMTTPTLINWYTCICHRLISAIFFLLHHLQLDRRTHVDCASFAHVVAFLPWTSVHSYFGHFECKCTDQSMTDACKSINHGVKEYMVQSANKVTTQWYQCCYFFFHKCYRVNQVFAN